MGCGRSKKQGFVARRAKAMQDAGEMVLVRYNSMNRGQHLVVGPRTRRAYGYHAAGDIFYTYRVAAVAAPHLFEIVEQHREPPKREKRKPVVANKTVPVREATPPAAGEEVESLEGVRWVTPRVIAQLNAMGIHTRQELIALGPEKFAANVDGVGKKKAEKIIASLMSPDVI